MRVNQFAGSRCGKDQAKAISGRQAVLSSLGVPFSLKPITVYSQGMANIVQAMQHHGVRRLVCVSATPVDTSRTDLADCMLRQLDDEENVHQALAVMTVSGQPGFLKFFLSEGIGKKTA